MEKKLKILVVDDDPSNRDGLLEVLDAHETKGAANGEEALKIAGADNFDLIVTDHNMPGISGIELIRRLKSRGYVGKIIFMSSCMSQILVEKAMKAGVDSVHNKFEPSRILVIISDLFGK